MGAEWRREGHVCVSAGTMDPAKVNRGPKPRAAEGTEPPRVPMGSGTRDCHHTGRPQGPRLLHCEPRSFPDGGSEAELPPVSEGLLPRAGRRVTRLRAQALPQWLSVALSGCPRSAACVPSCRMGTVTTALPPGGRADLKPEASALSPDLAQASAHRAT